MLSKMYGWCAVWLQFIFRIFPIKNNKILSFNYGGQGYGDNGKYVCDTLINETENIHVVWPLAGNYQLGNAPINVKPVKFHSISFFYHLATSKIWLSNVRVPLYFRKRKQQYYIQLWHGMPALKRIEADVADSLTISYIKMAKHDSELADLFISDSKYWTQFIKEAFWYDGAILECGTPRIDQLINRTVEQKKSIKKKLNISESRVVLYAPTFRKDMSLDCYSLDYVNLKHVLEEKTKDSWHVCVRMHPNITSNGIVLPELPGVTDFSKYPDMYELLKMTDLLITDYSSTMFEAGFANIPVILFATDIEKYQKDRNFYFNLTDLPFPLVTSNEELFEKIKHWRHPSYAKSIEQFKNQLRINEMGNASKQLSQHIRKIMESGRK